MTLRIAKQVAEGGSVVALHGWLRDDGVTEFESVAARPGLPLRLGLGHLAGASANGLQALLRQQERGAQITLYRAAAESGGRQSQGFQAQL